MSFHMLVKDDDILVEIIVPGKYNPDIFDDSKNRLMAMYEEALGTRYKLLLTAACDGVEDEEANGDSEVSDGALGND